jgi:hypothetical protein
MHVGQRRADLAAGVARGQAAHVDALAAVALGALRANGGLSPRPDGVHADAVAQQRAAALAPAGVDADHGHAQRVVLVQAQAADQLVGQAALAGAAGAGDAQHGIFLACLRAANGGHQRRVGLAVLQCGDQLRQRAPGGFGVALNRLDGGRAHARQVLVAAHHHLADHPCRPMRWPSSGL